jgi:hypothetical protein
VLTYTLSHRYQSIMEETNSNPGPADYQSLHPPPILSRSKNSKQTSFGTGSRFVNGTSQIPGAGHYSLSTSKLSQFDQKYSIGKAERTPRIENTPGRKNGTNLASDYHKMSFVEESIKNKIGKSINGKLTTTFLNEKTTINAFHKYF